MENTPTITTQRLLLRRFEPQDANAFGEIMSDEKTNEFLPWFPVKTIEEATARLNKSFIDSYDKPLGFRYAVCLMTDNIPIGYVNLRADRSPDASNDFGYGLRHEFWHRGIISEASAAIATSWRMRGASVSLKECVGRTRWFCWNLLSGFASGEYFCAG